MSEKPRITRLQAEIEATVALDGGTRRACNDPTCENEWPCPTHPVAARPQPSAPPDPNNCDKCGNAMYFIGNGIRLHTLNGLSDCPSASAEPSERYLGHSGNVPIFSSSPSAAPTGQEREEADDAYERWALDRIEITTGRKPSREAWRAGWLAGRAALRASHASQLAQAEREFYEQGKEDGRIEALRASGKEALAASRSATDQSKENL